MEFFQSNCGHAGMENVENIRVQETQTESSFNDIFRIFPQRDIVLMNVDDRSHQNFSFAKTHRLFLQQMQADDDIDGEFLWNRLEVIRSEWQSREP